MFLLADDVHSRDDHVAIDLSSQLVACHGLCIGIRHLRMCLDCLLCADGYDSTRLTVWWMCQANRSMKANRSKYGEACSSSTDLLDHAKYFVFRLTVSQHVRLVAHVAAAAAAAVIVSPIQSRLVDTIDTCGCCIRDTLRLTTAVAYSTSHDGS